MIEEDKLFEWDSDKAATNLAKHGVSFENAKKAFDDYFAVDVIDKRFNYGEDRYNLLGMVGDRLLVVSYTMRNDIIRIISARGAEPHERRKYYRNIRRLDEI
jgi:uncharacterized DUF497 family protein